MDMEDVAKGEGGWGETTMGAVGGGVVRLGRSLRGGSHRRMMNRTGAWWGGGTFPWGMVEERSQEPFPDQAFEPAQIKLCQPGRSLS